MSQIGSTVPNIYQQHQRTKDVIQRLENKLTSQLQQRKTTEEALLFSQEPTVQAKPSKNTFKVFSKPKKEQAPLQIAELDGPDEKEREKERERFSRSQGGQLIEEVEAIEALVRKKLALKEERVGQLEREVALEQEEKLHLYHINCQLEQELEQLEISEREEQYRVVQEEELMEKELAHMRKVLETKKGENKRLKKEEELLKQTLKGAQRNRKGYIEAEIRANKRQKIEEECLRGLVVELDRLKDMVKKRMGKSKSKSRIKLR